MLEGIGLGSSFDFVGDGFGLSICEGLEFRRYASACGTMGIREGD